MIKEEEKGEDTTEFVTARDNNVTKSDAYLTAYTHTQNESGTDIMY